MSRLRLFALILAVLSQTGIDYGSGQPMSLGRAKRHASYMFTGLSGTGILSTAGSTYIAVIANNSGSDATKQLADGIVTTDGWIQDLEVLLGADIGSSGDNLVVSLELNDSTSSPALDCTISGDTGTQIRCDDGLNTNRVRVLADDLVVWHLQTAGTPDANVFLSIRATFVPDLPNVSPLLSNSQVHDSATRYAGLVGRHQAEGKLLEAATLFPRGGVISDVAVSLFGFPGSGKTRKFEWVDGTGASFSPEVSCTIADFATTCQDAEADTINVSAGDVVSIKSTVTVGAPGAGFARYGATFTSTTRGFILANVSDVTRHATQFQRDVVSGVDGFRSTNNERSQMLTGPMTLTDFYVELGTDPLGSVEFFSYADGSTTGLECDVNTTPFTCNDTGKNIPIANGSVVYSMVHTGTSTVYTGATLISYAARIE